MAFSGALTLTDLSDFITPSQACIRPVEQVKPKEDSRDLRGLTEIEIDSSGSYYEVSANGLSPNKPNSTKTKKLEQAQISLNDCLACSGCITSAESVLITLQSHTEVLNFLESNPNASSASHKVPVLSIAPQSLASLAASLSSSSGTSISLDRVYRRVRAFCSQVLGFDHVCDTTFARHITLLEHAQEFQERRKGEGRLPMLASACPGWVCYAEKAHPEMLPFIARTKSPQQVMGTLVKEWLSKRWGKKPNEIYHVSVMPCYDKKLEASRQDFHNEIYSTRDVDCVITTGELELMMRDKGWDLSIPAQDELEPLPQGNPVFEIPELISHPGTSSGSYLHSLLSMLELTSPSALELSVHTVRSSDYEEYILKKRVSGEVVFKGAKCYGFRNLQNVVRKVGREAGVQVGKGAAGKMAGGLKARIKKTIAEREGAQEKGYDYVEVMACPGGCVNGGGQLKPPTSWKKEDAEGYERNWNDSGVEIAVTAPGFEGAVQNAKWGDKEWTKSVEKAYWHDLLTPPASPKPAATGENTPVEKADRLATQILLDLCRPREYEVNSVWAMVMNEDAESCRRNLFRTQYRAVESDVIGLAVKW